MQIREYKESDLNALRQIHAAQGFGYDFPDLADPLFLTKLVLEEENREPGQGIVGAAVLRLTSEAYLLLDPKAGKPRERWHWLVGLQHAAERDAEARGLADTHAWLPPEIGKQFGRRLSRLGWVRDDLWTPYCKRFEARTK